MKCNFKNVLLCVVIVYSLITSTQAQSDLVLYLPFTGNAADASTYGNNGTVYGATLTTDRGGNTNSAYYFDGINDYIEVSDNSSLNPDYITIAAWINSEVAPLHTPDIIRKSTWSDASDEQYLLRLGNDVNVQAGIKANTTCNYGAPWTLNTVTNGITNADWYFLTATFDGSALKIYINGNFVQQTTLSTPSPLIKCGGNLRIGMAWQDYPNCFKGIIDEVRIYSRALRPCEISALYNLPPSTDPVSTSVIYPNGKSIEIFPNPSNVGFIEIKGSITGQRFEVQEMTGRKLISGILQEKIDISFLKTGMYIINIYDKEGNTFSERIIKQ